VHDSRRYCGVSQDNERCDEYIYPVFHNHYSRNTNIDLDGLAAPDVFPDALKTMGGINLDQQKIYITYIHSKNMFLATINI
jgi:hypothetical protein